MEKLFGRERAREILADLLEIAADIPVRFLYYLGEFTPREGD